MRAKPRSVFAVPVDLVQPKVHGIALIVSQGKSSRFRTEQATTFPVTGLGMTGFSTWVQRKTGKRRKKRANDAIAADLESIDIEQEHAEVPSRMAQTNGIHRELTPTTTSIVPPGRVISTSMMRQGSQNCKSHEFIANGEKRRSNRRLPPILRKTHGRQL